MKELWQIVCGLSVLALGVAAILGWIMNVVAVFNMTGNSEVTTMFVARCVGIFFAPLGAVLGYC